MVARRSRTVPGARRCRSNTFRAPWRPRLQSCIFFNSQSIAVTVPAGGSAMSPKQVIKDPTDGFIVDEVGAWASEKHERLRKYIDAYRSARDVFAAHGHRRCGLYRFVFGAWPISDRGHRPIYRWQPARCLHGCAAQRNAVFGAPFNDLDRDSVDALRQRIANLGGTANYFSETAEAAVDPIIYALNPAGLHFAFLDPYNLENLPFSIIE